MLVASNSFSRRDNALHFKIVRPIRGIPIDLDQFRAPVRTYFVSLEAMRRDRN
jgi:hypothetical protein